MDSVYASGVVQMYRNRTVHVPVHVMNDERMASLYRSGVVQQYGTLLQYIPKYKCFLFLSYMSVFILFYYIFSFSLVRSLSIRFRHKLNRQSLWPQNPLENQVNFKLDFKI